MPGGDCLNYSRIKVLIPPGAHWLMLAITAVLFLLVVVFVDLKPVVEENFFFSTSDPGFAQSRQIERRFPSQPQPGTALGFHEISGLYPDQPGHPGRESRRLHEAGDPLAVGVLGGAQQHAVPGKALQLAPGGIKANVHQDVVADEHVAAHVTSSLA